MQVRCIPFLSRRRELFQRCCETLSWKRDLISNASSTAHDMVTISASELDPARKGSFKGKNFAGQCDSRWVFQMLTRCSKLCVTVIEIHQTLQNVALF